MTMKHDGEEHATPAAERLSGRDATKTGGVIQRFLSGAKEEFLQPDLEKSLVRSLTGVLLGLYGTLQRQRQRQENRGSPQKG
jgi:hypothetical protein